LSNTVQTVADAVKCGSYSLFQPAYVAHFLLPSRILLR
jgi:hypothetical protein